MKKFLPFILLSLLINSCSNPEGVATVQTFPLQGEYGLMTKRIVTYDTTRGPNDPLIENFVDGCTSQSVLTVDSNDNFTVRIFALDSNSNCTESYTFSGKFTNYQSFGVRYGDVIFNDNEKVEGAFSSGYDGVRDLTAEMTITFKVFDNLPPNVTEKFYRYYFFRE